VPQPHFAAETVTVGVDVGRQGHARAALEDGGDFLRGGGTIGGYGERHDIR